jgi:DNA repair protein RadC
MEYTPLNQWSEDDRPREKMLLKGRQALSDSELLAIIIGSGSRGESAVDLSKRILRDYNNNFNELGKISIRELTNKYKGIGEAKAINIMAALELGRRRSESAPSERKKISSSRDAYLMLAPYLEDLYAEEFYVILLTRSNTVIKVEHISKGGIHATVVDVRVVAKLALENNAVSVILAHNHPSGSLKPSQQDLNITQKLKEGCALLDISILDHLILGHQSYYSFADEGVL